MTNQQRRVHSYERYTSRTILRFYTFTERSSDEKRFYYTSSLLFSKVSSINVLDDMKNDCVGPREGGASGTLALGPASTRALRSQKPKSCVSASREKRHFVFCKL